MCCSKPSRRPSMFDAVSRRSLLCALALAIVLPLRAADPLPVVLHQLAQDLLTDSHAQIEQGALGIYERSQHGERDLDRDGLCGLDDLEICGRTGMLGHGGSFLVWLPRPYHTDGEGAAVLILSLLQVQQPPGHPRALSARRERSNPALGWAQDHAYPSRLHGGLKAPLFGGDGLLRRRGLALRARRQALVAEQLRPPLLAPE